METGLTESELKMGSFRKSWPPASSCNRSRSSAREAIDNAGAPAWRRVGAILIGVRGIPGCESAGGALSWPHAVRVPDFTDVRDDEVQSAHVNARSSVPSAFEPVRMSC